MISGADVAAAGGGGSGGGGAAGGVEVGVAGVGAGGVGSGGGGGVAASAKCWRDPLQTLNRPNLALLPDLFPEV